MLVQSGSALSTQGAKNLVEADIGKPSLLNTITGIDCGVVAGCTGNNRGTSAIPSDNRYDRTSPTEALRGPDQVMAPSTSGTKNSLTSSGK
jgi:hypothetical protein